MTGVAGGNAAGAGVTVTRHFVTTASGRQVHYRRAGSGPAIVMCHESPLSSISLADAVAWLSRRFTVIALDNPGYGQSEQLDHHDPLIGEYAEALRETLDALGLQRVQLHGAHTGAFIALEFALRYPERAAALLTDGLPVFDPDDTVNLLGNYLPKWEPQWDGSHLLWAWMRYRDQHIFWPWFEKRRDARLDIDMASATWLNEGVLDMLRAGDDFRIAYTAAFRYHSFPRVQELQVPTAIIAREDDLNHPDLAKLPDPLPAGVFKLAVPRERRAWAAEMLRIYSELPPGDVAPPPPPVARRPGAGPAARITRDYADTPYGQLLVRRLGDPVPGQLPLLMLHASPGSAVQLEPLQRALAAAGRETIALDTLGNGESDKAPWTAPAIADYANAVAHALDALGLERVDAYGSHTGATIALELALAHPARIGSVVLDGAPLFTPEEVAEALARYTPPLEPRDDGTHLLQAWNFLKDGLHFFPWFDKRSQAMLHMEGISAADLNTWCVEMLKSGETYPKAYRAAFRYPTRERLPQLAARTLVCSVAADPLAASSEEAAGLAPAGRWAALPDDPAAQSAVIAGFLAGGA